MPSTPWYFHDPDGSRHEAIKAPILAAIPGFTPPRAITLPDGRERVILVGEVRDER